MIEPYTHHPYDPRTILTGDFSPVADLMRRTDVDSVIVKRPHLSARYKEIFAENAGQTIKKWHAAAGVYERLPFHSMMIELDQDMKEPKDIYIPGWGYGDKMKSSAPPELWTDFSAISGIIAGLTQKKQVKAEIFQQVAGEIVEDDANSDFHNHIKPERHEVTGHVSTTDAGIDIVLGLTARTLRGVMTANNKFLPFYYEDQILPHAKILSTEAGDAAFFKPHVIHRKSPKAFNLGRSAFGIYQSYQPGMTY